VNGFKYPNIECKDTETGSEVKFNRLEKEREGVRY
jgi:hypothetical protein